MRTDAMPKPNIRIGFRTRIGFNMNVYLQAACQTVIAVVAFAALGCIGVGIGWLGYYHPWLHAFLWISAAVGMIYSTCLRNLRGY